MSIRRHTISTVGALFALTAMTEAAYAQAIITHTSGRIVLGVQEFGNLNQGDGVLSAQGEDLTGVRYVKPGASGQLEYTAGGSPWEGWGVGFNGIFGGGANNDEFGSNVGSNLTAISFNNTASTATSIANTIADTSAQLQVTHSFLPSVDANLYQVNVTITNIGTATANDVRYRRIMDWDIETTSFAERVEIGGWPASALVASDNNGFNTVDPTGPFTGGVDTYLPNQNFGFADSGVDDQGASFEFAFGNLSSNSSITFQIFYGGQDSRDLALGSLGAVGAEVYSLAEPDLPTTDPNYSVAIFGFKGVGGTVIAVAPEPGTMSLLFVGLVGAGFTARRRKASK
jgi:hypothetical protein